MSKGSHFCIIGVALLIVGIGFIYCYWNYSFNAPARNSSNSQSPTEGTSTKKLPDVVSVLNLNNQLEPNCGCKPQTGINPPHILGYPMFANQSVVFNGTLVGDMILQESDLHKMSGFQAAVDGKHKKWPKGEVPFRFADNLIPNKFRKLIYASLKELSAATGHCVRFREIDSPEGQGHINIIAGGGCYSYIGRVKMNGQPLSLAVEGCMHAHIIQHEFIHALGFFHEQSRPDRQEHILVNWDNIETKYCSNFEICRGCTMLSHYDRESIMHYSGQAFSCNTKPTMFDKASKTPIKHNEKLTATDVLKIRRFYKCT